jgi:hypothetical protein
MKIEALVTFLDGRNRFEFGDVRTVPDEYGARFCAAGWAKDITGTAATGEATIGGAELSIHNSTLGTADTN